MMLIKMVDSHLLFTSLNIKMMKRIFIFIVLTLISSVLFSQEVVSSSGETKTVSGYEVSWTVGEIVIETVSSGANILTQGFHQSKLTITSVTKFDYPGIEMNVFPNPTSDNVNIHFNKLIENSSYSLFDMSGKLVEKKKINSTNTELSLKKYTSGQYILKLIRNTNQPLQTFKIIKK